MRFSKHLRNVPILWVYWNAFVIKMMWRLPADQIEIKCDALTNILENKKFCFSFLNWSSTALIAIALGKGGNGIEKTISSPAVFFYP